MLRFEPEAGDFLVLPRVVQLKVGDQLACPEPFRADFMIGDDLCSFALIGGTSVRYLGPDEQSSVGFDIQQGALLFETHGLRAAAENADAAKPQKPSLPITVIFYGQQARLELASNNAVCGIEVRRSEPNNFEVEPAAPGFTASLHVAQGTVRFTTADGKTATVEGPGFLPITSGATANEKRSEIERASLLILPDWLEPDPKRAATKLKRPYNAAFEKEFDAEQLLQLSLPAVVNHPRPALSELAVKCLAAHRLLRPAGEGSLKRSSPRSSFGGDHWLATMAAARPTASRVAESGTRKALPAHRCRDGLSPVVGLRSG